MHCETSKFASLQLSQLATDRRPPAAIWLRRSISERFRRAGRHPRPGGANLSSHGHALAGMGQLSVLTCVVVASVAAVLGDLIWYALGRTHGHSILNLVCRLSLEPDSCVSNTKQQWNRFGGFTLIFAKFVPGLSTVSTPLAGLTHMRSDISGSESGSDRLMGLRLSRCWVSVSQSDGARG